MGILGVIELFLGFIALASPWIVGASFIWVIGIMPVSYTHLTLPTILLV